jgi:hypothetical protein
MKERKPGWVLDEAMLMLAGGTRARSEGGHGGPPLRTTNAANDAGEPGS